jgi:CRP-like cAMP-binding protein
MPGKIVQTLRASPLASSLSEAELRLVANCARLMNYTRGEIILDANRSDERMYILREGQVSLHLTVWTETGRCSGEATRQLTSPGEIFGWATWIRQDFLSLSARATGPVTLVVFDFQRLGDAQSFMKISQRTLQLLYGTLQEHGLCPPNIQAWLKLKRLLLEGEIV